MSDVGERVGRSGDPRAEKVAVVNEVRDKLSSAGAAILTEYRGLKVSELEGLRRSLGQAGGEYKVYKNTLVRLATRDVGMEGIDPLLEGPTAVAFADSDVPAVARALRDFSRAHPVLVVKGGVMGTSVLSADDATALADIPSREVLLARLAGLMAAPMQQLAGLLQALPRNLAYGLQALVDAGGGSGAPSPADAPSPTDAPSPDADAGAVATAEAADPEPPGPELSGPEPSGSEPSGSEPSRSGPPDDAPAGAAPTDLTDQPAENTADEPHEGAQ